MLVSWSVAAFKFQELYILAWHVGVNDEAEAF